MAPEFVFFDLGKVLIDFDHDRAARQLAEASGTEFTATRAAIITRLGLAYDRGDLDTAAFCEQFRQMTGAVTDDGAVCRAISDIFQINAPIIPLVTALHRSAVPLGILSNTCDAHWEWLLREKYAVLDLFDVHALSFRLKAVKPEPEIYARAAELAGCAPSRIFFVDDVAENVEGALRAGWDAILFQGVPDLARQLRERGVRTNY